MRVIATAGHVDHGKSTLVRALTGMEPDRWAEERRRGMTIDLGFAWTALPSGERVAFVDVPGHERFVTNMLAGVGSCPAVMFVVAADAGWQAQSAEHLAALDALGVRHGLLVVTRSDLADPAEARRQAYARLAGTSLAGIDAVAVSGLTGDGLPDLAAALDRVLSALPEPDREAPVRLWIDRVFTVAGAGTVVTGTLAQGTLAVGDELVAGAQRVRVRGLQTLNERTDRVHATARVAVNLRSTGRSALSRGATLLTPGAWSATDVADVRLEPAAAPQGDLVLHIGSAAMPARLRPLGSPGDLARISLARPVPLRVGDRALLRDPGRRSIVAGVRVLDVRPPPLRRRGAAAARAAQLAGVAAPAAADLLRWHGLLTGADLTAMGCPPGGRPVAGDWFADPSHWSALQRRLAALDPGLTVDAAAALLGLPDRKLAEALVAPPLTVRNGRIQPIAAAPPPAVAAVAAELAERPFHAPSAERLAELGLTGRTLATVTRSGLLLSIAKNVVLLPEAPEAAAAILRRLPGPFTVGDARAALGTSRRVAVPLLEYLDARGLTRRIDNERRVCPESSPPDPSGPGKRP
ncbi:selenocysteine-specific translation elongation factor [Planomonospora sp. ID67723]|uniref:selenocysteine-specific translation elongation factor n=1 Tax=Planomonospora sp. ID67723 TaxID=2738134 RepID=UPI0018C4058E|nr:selenocysteine-specific translation elongation factor [Planomonospora sp. ID67723]MBG0828881.1 selenocysteine-specific translation elongation factor [Planomonospora sp. ID67723]